MVSELFCIERFDRYVTSDIYDSAAAPAPLNFVAGCTSSVNRPAQKKAVHLRK